MVYVPNGSMSTAVVVNYSRLDTRRVEWTIGIDYGEDVDKARAAILEALGREPLILADPEPTVALGALADSSVNLTVRVWTKTGDYWPVFNNGYRLIYDAFNAKGINFPYPNQTVHIVRE